MTVWQSLVECEPRLQHLCNAAVGLAYRGCSPDEVYAAAKPFVDFLVGGGRGSNRTVADDRRLRREFDDLFKSVLRMEPKEIFDYQVALLENQLNRDVAVTHIYDMLCSAYDRRAA
jgi:hypothetical protein